MRLEYSTPRGNADDSLEGDVLVASLEKFKPQPLPVIAGSDGAVMHAHAAWLVGRGERESALKWAEQLSLWAPALPLSTWLTSQPFGDPSR